VASLGKARLQALLHELYAEVGTVLSRRRNYRLDPAAMQRLVERLRMPPPGSLADLAVVDVKRLDGTKLILEDGSWVLLRLSGTEPVVRLYVEASSPERLEALTAAGEAMIHGR
jgi:phosphomannomutase